jgi:hypothetical protein
MVKSAEYGVSHNSAWSVETMPLVLELMLRGTQLSRLYMK